MWQALTPWLATNGGGRTAEFYCGADVPISYRVKGHHNDIGRYTEAGEEYYVFPTGVAGVGMALRVVYFGGSGGKSSPAGDHEQEAYSGRSGVGDIGSTFFVKFVRTGDITYGSATTHLHMAIEARLFESGASSPIRKQVYVTPTTLKVQDKPSCRMRAQEVNMGLIPIIAFKGVGTTAGQRTYELALDCEAGVGQVDYQVVPTTAVIDAGLGLAEATGGVKGVAYQFLESGDVPMRFYSTGLFGYGSASAQVLRKTFGVRYRQTESTITPGPANAGLTFSLTFP
ncbi:fimbrial protein [Stenotrophomonas sepilia]|uniref:fimbrial protein n=1 Tax=Stenotrophomonas sepilia TaxID=2860290 RepID=UPI00333EDFB4